MTTSKALLGALVATIVSCGLLTLARGIPTRDQLVNGSITMFAIAFIVLKFTGRSSTDKPNGTGT